MQDKPKSLKALTKLNEQLGGLRLPKGTAAERVVMKAWPDTELGAARREQLKEFGERYGRDRHAAAKEAHRPWIKEAQQLWGINRYLSVNETAKKVKGNLGLSAGLTTIREAIREFRPPKLRS